jgi:broad specificity phosphatase PhoE
VIPTAKRYPSVLFEIWDVEEFTYLSPERFAGTTQADRKPMVDSYWGAGDQSLIDGPGAESFVELLERAKMMLDQLGHTDAKSVLIFSHGQFIRAVAWFIQHGEEAGSPDMMRRFRKLDVGEPLVNCAGYEIVLKTANGRLNFSSAKMAL